MICHRCGSRMYEDRAFAHDFESIGVVRHRYFCVVGHNVYDPPPRPADSGRAGIGSEESEAPLRARARRRRCE